MPSPKGVKFTNGIEAAEQATPQAQAAALPLEIKALSRARSVVSSQKPADP